MDETRLRRNRPRVVIIGAGFGGLEAARRLAKQPVDVLLIDRNNYHGFWPLLYQVATAELDASHIAQPVRKILRDAPNLDFRLATVTAIDREQRRVITDRASYEYDQLIVAAGSTSNFFGLDEIQTAGFDLKDLPEAIGLRNHILQCFERAVDEKDPEQLRRRLTFVIVGGGPTGVEVAGALAEMLRFVMRQDFPTIDFAHVRVVLVEMADRVLLPFPPALSRKAQRTLEELGVELRFGASVVGYADHTLRFKDGSELPTETVIWAAGVKGAPLGAALGVALQRGGRVPVTATLQLPDDPRVWVIGDLAYLEAPGGKPYPQLATVAMQQGRLVARNILRQLKHQPPRPFRYTDKGSMATIGRNSAVAQIRGLTASGFLAWLLWLVVHIYYLIGFRNRLLVLVSWAYNYLTYERSSRAILTVATRAAQQASSEGAVDDGLAVPAAEPVAEPAAAVQP